MYQRCINEMDADQHGRCVMAWKSTGQPTVRKQRDKWVVRVDGIDTSTGKHRPRQLGTYLSQRSATAAARSMKADDRSTERGTVSWLVRRYVASRTDITVKAQQQYEWAIPHIENGLGAIQLSILDREDIARWIEALAAGGKIGRRSIQICRTVLRAALSEAVDEGLIPRSPAARVGMPRTIAKETKTKEAVAWDAADVDRFLLATADHRWAVAFRVGVLYGLRRSEVLALRWDDLDTDAGSLRIDESLVSTNEGAAWSNAKNERSRRTIPIDDDTMRMFARRRAEQAAERLAAGAEWEDNDLVIATRTGKLVLPRSYDRALATIVDKVGLPRLTSHGLRHTAATHMVQQATDLGELRAIADILGHSPEMLMNTYAHALPNSQLAVVDRIGKRR
jgi:integrase